MIKIGEEKRFFAVMRFFIMQAVCDCGDYMSSQTSQLYFILWDKTQKVGLIQLLVDLTVYFLIFKQTLEANL